jgi:hypothetical protein
MTASPLVLLALVLPMASGPEPGLASAPGRAAGARETGTVTLTGEAVLLTDVLKASGVACDAEPLARQVVLREPDGTATPLLSDEASRALFLDERLRNRPVRVQGRWLAGLPYLQVVLFRVARDGEWHTPEYYCDVCSISVRYPQICPCCQGNMELRMQPGEP